jgi:hypothetical protein
MRAVPAAAKLTIFICRLSLNLEALISWNPQGLSRDFLTLAIRWVLEQSRQGTHDRMDLLGYAMQMNFKK